MTIVYGEDPPILYVRHGPVPEGWVCAEMPARGGYPPWHVLVLRDKVAEAVAQLRSGVLDERGDVRFHGLSLEPRDAAAWADAMEGAALCASSSGG